MSAIQPKTSSSSPRPLLPDEMNAAGASYGTGTVPIQPPLRQPMPPSSSSLTGRVSTIPSEEMASLPAPPIVSPSSSNSSPSVSFSATSRTSEVSAFFSIHHNHPDDDENTLDNLLERCIRSIPAEKLGRIDPHCHQFIIQAFRAGHEAREIYQHLKEYDRTRDWIGSSAGFVATVRALNRFDGNISDGIVSALEMELKKNRRFLEKKK